jgi:hypothetical protein
MNLTPSNEKSCRMSQTLNITGEVSDEAGNVVAYSATATVNLPPEISSVVIDPEDAPANAVRTITVTASDPDNDLLEYTCLVDGQPATPTATPGVFTYDPTGGASHRRR